MDEIVKYESDTCRHENIQLSNEGDVTCRDCATAINKDYFDWAKKQGIQTDYFYIYRRVR